MAFWQCVKQQSFATCREAWMQIFSNVDPWEPHLSSLEIWFSSCCHPSCVPTHSFPFTDVQCSHRTPPLQGLLRGDSVALVTLLMHVERVCISILDVMCSVEWLDIFSFNKICHGVSCEPAKHTVAFCCSELSVLSSVWCFHKLPSAPQAH